MRDEKRKPIYLHQKYLTSNNVCSHVAPGARAVLKVCMDINLFFKLLNNSVSTASIAVETEFIITPTNISFLVSVIILYTDHFYQNNARIYWTFALKIIVINFNNYLDYTSRENGFFLDFSGVVT